MEELEKKINFANKCVIKKSQALHQKKRKKQMRAKFTKSHCKIKLSKVVNDQMKFKVKVKKDLKRSSSLYGVANKIKALSVFNKFEPSPTYRSKYTQLLK